MKVRQRGEEQSKDIPDFQTGIGTFSNFFALVLEEYTMFSSLEGSGRTSEDRGTQLRRMLGVPFGEWSACSLYPSGWWEWLGGDAHWLYIWDPKISRGGVKYWWINEYQKSILSKHGRESRIKSPMLNNCCDVKKCLKPWGLSPASCLNIPLF